MDDTLLCFRLYRRGKKRKQNVGREEMKVYKRTDSFAEQSKKK